MRIVIAGAGEVGMYLARLLSIESQDIILIDENKKLLNKVQQELDIFTLTGDAGSPRILKDANVAAADLLIAVTSSEKTNLMVASFGKQLGAKFTIARVSNPEYLNRNGDLNMSSLGVDMVISPEDLAANEIASLVKRSLFTDTFEFAGGKMLLLGLHLDGSEPIVNKTIEETAILNPNDSFSCVAIQRDGKTIIPRGDTFFLRDDHAYFLAVEGCMAEVLKLTGREEHRIKNVMIMGGGKVGMCTIDKIKKRKKIKLIEKDPERCLDAADKYSDVLVINDDGHNVKLLEDENIEEMDAFVAVTGNSETNIISLFGCKSTRR
jgi:trk system potassium uptake protein TrkA